MITLAPLSPRKVHDDQLKIKRESEQSSGDGSSKERVGRIAYCSIHVPFQQEFEEKFSKPFHNDRANIRG